MLAKTPSKTPKKSKVDSNELVSAKKAAPAPPPVSAQAQADAPELAKVLKEYIDKVGAVRAAVQELNQRVKDGELPTSKGISFLEVKSQLLLQYCVNLACFLLLKVGGQSIVGHTVITQLVTLRIFLEKIRPIDQKLKYQVDKLLKTAQIGNLTSTAVKASAKLSSSSENAEEDPLHFRPNPAALLAKSGGGDEDEEDADNMSDDDQSASSSSKVYRPPMMEAVYYHEDERADAREKQKRDKQIRRVASSSIMQQLREEFSDRPMESKVYGVDRPEQDLEDRVRTEYEEDNMVRLPTTRKDKQKRKQAQKAALGIGKTLADEFSEQFDDLERVNRIRPSKGRSGAGGFGDDTADMMNALDSFRKSDRSGSRGGGRGGRGGRGGSLGKRNRPQGRGGGSGRR